MSYQPPITRYSTVVEMWLVANGREHRLSHSAPDFVIPSRAEPIPRGPATLVVQVDGNEDRTAVQVLGKDESYPDRIRISRAASAS